MSRITIDIPEDAEALLEQHRTAFYPHCKKISRMMLEISVNEVKKVTLGIYTQDKKELT